MSEVKTLPEEPDDTLKQLLKTHSKGRFRRRWPWVIAALIILGALAAWRLGIEDETATARYRTEPAVVGELVVTVSATGNLQPTNQVDVGSELSGIVEVVCVDVNDQVTEGQELARLDLSKLRDAVARSEANLAVAEAQVIQAEATVAEAQATLSRYNQVARLSGGKVPSKSEMDTARANLKRAEANAAGARAGVVQAQANLQSEKTDLSKASVRSPINGVVLDRQVEPGQTVAASFQAPVLFTLAEDLTKMELQVDVDEADVGQVQAGQLATFGVDAWPGRRYAAVIERVGYGAREKDGVISYPTVLAVRNDDLSLRPGMTGSAEITTLTRENALLAPNAALRFSPPEAAGAPRTRSGGGVLTRLFPRPSRRGRERQMPAAGGAPRVWVLRDGAPVAVDVQTGATNGRVTEITGGALEPGMPLITEALGGAS